MTAVTEMGWVHQLFWLAVSNLLNLAVFRFANRPAFERWRWGQGWEEKEKGRWRWQEEGGGGRTCQVEKKEKEKNVWRHHQQWTLPAGVPSLVQSESISNEGYGLWLREGWIKRLCSFTLPENLAVLQLWKGRVSSSVDRPTQLSCVPDIYSQCIFGRGESYHP